MTHHLPDPMRPECAGCGKQEPGTTLVPCTTCGDGVVYCGGECFSLHTGPQHRPAEAEVAQ